MANGINKVILIGNLGRDPEVKQLPSGDSVANLAVATSESYKDKETGERKEVTEWHRVVAFRQLADVIGKYLTKGSKVYLEGSLRTRKYEQDGVEKYNTEIVVREMRMLGDKASASSNDTPAPAAKPAAKKTSKPAPAPVAAGDDFEDDDIPF